MFKNYFKIAFRNLWKNKGYSAINIFGLACGLAVCMLITLYVIDELSYDRYNTAAENIYRVDSDIKFGGSELKLAVCSDPMGATLKKDYPQVEEYTRIYASSGSKLIKKGTEFITEQNVANVDSTFFNVFTLPALSGDTKTALNAPNTVVITETAAKKYFGTANALGKIVEADNTPYKVTAVIKDIPHNSHFHFDFLFSMGNVDYPFGTYLSHNFQTYIKLRPGTDYKAFEKNFTQVIDKYILPEAKQFMQINSMDDFSKAGNKLEYTLMPLLNIHLYSDRFPELDANGNIQYVYIFSAVALFVLLIACINFMNLSTARSANRAKEVGIRKVLGTGRKTLITQFLVESTVTVMISMIIAIGVAYLVLPLFNDIAAKSLSVNDLLSAKILPFIIALPFVVGILAGSYPALFLSKFKPITVLKGNAGKGLKKSNLRSTLVVIQFATSIILIIGTIVVYNQLNYIQTKKLGFNKDQVLVINGTGALDKNIDAFKNSVLGIKGVNVGTISSYLPVSASSRSDNTFSKEAVMTPQNGFNMQNWRIDYDYIKTLGMEIIKGRNFSKEYGADSTAIIINETAASLLGFKDPIGQKLYWSPDNNSASRTQGYTIIGVVRNFNYESLRQNIGPLCFNLSRSTGIASFRVGTADIKSLVTQVEDIWKTMAPGMPFSYNFLDDSFDNMYRSEQRIGTLTLIFAVLAIFIASLGLFGLATFMAEQRTKEIGIRKVLGASVQGIVQMLSKDFIKLVAIAFVFAAPVAWYFMHTWLQDFAYRTDISWWIFALAGSGALAIALLTVSFQAIRAALMNPTKSLRTE
ncbi:MAG TPA: ABC transporter permease [Panacibacter sp.]|nr:ABC transporter permease [Panacibacter sp.]